MKNIRKLLFPADHPWQPNNHKTGFNIYNMIHLKGFQQKHFIILFLFLLPSLSLQAQELDILLKGGHLIDPKNNINTVMDVGIADGKIAEIAPNISEKRAVKLINIAGLYITPGLLDMHVHVFMGNEPGVYIANGATSVMPDGFTFKAGVTTVVDAGSSGWRNFPLFKEQTIDKAKTRVLALLNIVGTGMRSRFEEQDVSDMNPVMTAHSIKKLYPDILVGIKAAHYWGDFTQVDLAVEAGEKAGVPVMVDFGEHDPPNSIESLFMEHLRPGDIFTHTYSYGPSQRETIVDEKGKVKSFVFEAQQKGIVFDLGHGGGAFSWRQAVPATEQGFKANVISSDLHTQSMNSGMKDLSNVLSKFMAMDVPLTDVIYRATWSPAQVIGRPDLGHLSIGAEADVAVFNLREGNFGFIDVRGMKIKGSKKLETELTIRAGKIVWDLNGLAAKDFRK
ncbi:amidohydrolase/deacetylase family metallohydrolase [Flagellimonas sp. S3867]|uniref:amidohydrolase/deacetylase family metallohydrolase n=1 Tax=Flagellimonas sp. S3867 TaxID=2768063 RepID=UPI001CC22E36|nr:amidohydrolase/deacetylase family metallohydrolase [Flagellimonas sp. S3867]